MTIAPYRFFLAGIIQGSKQGMDVHNQDYRPVVRGILKESFPGCRILCPVENHPDSVAYPDARARAVFLKHLAEVKRSHGLVVYLPEASMGSAIELWEAFREKTLKVTVSPLATNWVVRILSDKILPDLGAFERFVRSGEMGKVLETRFGARNTGEPGP
jgi:hypothetical protein